jgi:hypothetical protein
LNLEPNDRISQHGRKSAREEIHGGTEDEPEHVVMTEAHSAERE